MNDELKKMAQIEKEEKRKFRYSLKKTGNIIEDTFRHDMASQYLRKYDPYFSDKCKTKEDMDYKTPTQLEKIYKKERKNLYFDSEEELDNYYESVKDGNKRITKRNYEK